MSLFKSTTSLAPTLTVTTTAYSTTSATIEHDNSGIKAGIKGFFRGIVEKIEEWYGKIKGSITGSLSPEFKRVKPDGTMGEPIKVRGDKLSTTLTCTSTTATIYGIDKNAGDKYIKEIENKSLNRCIEATSTEELDEALDQIDSKLNQVQDENLKKINSLSDMELERLLQSHDLLPIDTNIKTNIK